MFIVHEKADGLFNNFTDSDNMVQTDNKFLDDLAKLATGAAGTLHGVRQELEGIMRQRLDRMLADLDLVTREEFEVVKAMAVAAREENEALKARLEALEHKTGRTQKVKKTTSRPPSARTGRKKPDDSA
jgi:BMFP domain-containing protein YqiC